MKRQLRVNEQTGDLEYRDLTEEEWEKHLDNRAKVLAERLKP